MKLTAKGWMTVVVVALIAIVAMRIITKHAPGLKPLLEDDPESKPNGLGNKNKSNANGLRLIA